MTGTIYEVAGGMQAFVRLAHAWHARCLADPIVSHAFSHGYHPRHTERMAGHPESADAVPDGLAMGRWSWNGVTGGL